ncbi:hypothetical protein AX16_009672 [Volvariella volvacea WC 439]|nr:hypothetical protein AX16_009672 [Volvariella volvacea WC 439]
MNYPNHPYQSRPPYGPANQPQVVQYYPPHQPAPFIPPGYETVIPSMPAAPPLGKRHRKRQPSGPTSAPPKSALKNPIPQPATAQPDPIPRPRTTSLSRHHAGPAFDGFDLARGNDPRIPPLHLFVTIRGNDILHFENITKQAVEEIRNEVIRLWVPGVEETEVEFDWIVKFREKPWDIHGPHNTTSWKMITSLFTLFARRGYTYQTSITIGNSSTRLVFSTNTLDPDSQFFLGYFSLDGRRFTLIDAPNDIHLSIYPWLQKVVRPPGAIKTVVHDQLRVLEIKRRNRIGKPMVAPAYFMMLIFRLISDFGYNVDSTFPLARRGPFNLRSRRELIVFKGKPNTNIHGQ